MLEQFLSDLESRLDIAVELDIAAQWQAFWTNPIPGGYFQPQRRRAAASHLPWPHIPINQAIRSPEMMLLREMAQNSQIIAAGNGQTLNIRSNYGTSILPSLFGVEPFFLEDSQDTLPTSLPLPGGTEAIRRLLDAGVPSLDRGWMPQVFETAAFYRETLCHYPRLQRFVTLYHPDLQGPADVAEVLCGSSIFMAFYDEPELVKDFLALITATYREALARWEREFPTPPGALRSHWNWAHRGTICLRDDSAMNFSPEMYAEFILPCDRELLRECGGGVVHFCGRGDHYIDLLADCEGLTGIQLSQPECNDMETIYRHTVDRGIRLLNLPRVAIEAAIRSGRDLHGLVQGQ